MNQSRLTRIIEGIVFISLVLSLLYAVLRLFVVSRQIRLAGDRPESDYVVIILQCLLGIFMMFLPGLLRQKFSIQIPNSMYLAFVLFLYCAIYLGEVRNFYNLFRYWDTILHTFSGGMLGALAFSFIALLNNSERVPMNLSPLFVALFSFCFSVTLGVLWEFYEFLADGLFGLNMQKFILSDGTLLVGHAALTDTILDLFVGALGALGTAILGYISLKHNKGWIDRLLVRSTTRPKE